MDWCDIIKRVTDGLDNEGFEAAQLPVVEV